MKKFLFIFSLIFLLVSCKLGFKDLDKVPAQKGAGYTDSNGNTVSVEFKVACTDSSSMENNVKNGTGKRYYAVFNRHGESPPYFGVWDTKDKVVIRDMNPRQKNGPFVRDPAAANRRFKEDNKSFKGYIGSVGHNNLDNIKSTAGGLYKGFQADPMMYPDHPLMGGKTAFMCAFQYIYTVTSPNGVTSGGTDDPDFGKTISTVDRLYACPDDLNTPRGGRYHRVFVTSSSFLGMDMTWLENKNIRPVVVSLAAMFGAPFEDGAISQGEPFMQYIGIFDDVRKKIYKDKRRFKLFGITPILTKEIPIEKDTSYMIEAKGSNDLASFESWADTGWGLSKVMSGEKLGQNTEGYCGVTALENESYDKPSEEETLIKDHIKTELALQGLDEKDGRYTAAYFGNSIGTFDYAGVYDIHTGMFIADAGDTDTLFSKTKTDGEFIPSLGTKIRIGIDIKGALQIDEQTNNLSDAKRYFGMVPTGVSTTAFNNYRDTIALTDKVGASSGGLQDGYYFDGKLLSGIQASQSANIASSCTNFSAFYYCDDRANLEDVSKTLEYLYLYIHDIHQLQTVMKEDGHDMHDDLVLRYGSGTGALPYSEISADVFKLLFADGSEQTVSGYGEIDKIVKVVGGQVVDARTRIPNPITGTLTREKVARLGQAPLMAGLKENGGDKNLFIDKLKEAIKPEDRGVLRRSVLVAVVGEALANKWYSDALTTVLVANHESAGYFLRGQRIVSARATGDIGFGYYKGQEPGATWYDWLDWERGAFNANHWTSDELIKTLAFYADNANGLKLDNRYREAIMKLTPNRFHPTSYRKNYHTGFWTGSIDIAANEEIKLFEDGDVLQDGWSPREPSAGVLRERSRDYTGIGNNVYFTLKDGREIAGSMDVFREITYFNGTKFMNNEVDD